MEYNKNEADPRETQDASQSIKSEAQNSGRQEIAHQNQAKQNKDVLRDLSEMDQQEGHMNNGTLGGNFNQVEEAEESNEEFSPPY